MSIRTSISILDSGVRHPSLVSDGTRGIALTSNGTRRVTLDSDDRPSSALVSGAGTAAANGTYTARGAVNGKPYYNLVGQPDDTDASSIVWGSGQWNLTNAETDNLYASSNDTAFPWLATFTVVAGTGPAPTVTQA